MQRKNGNWYVVLELDTDGDRKQKWISVKKHLGLSKKPDKPTAEKLLVELLADYHRGEYIEPSDMTVKDFLLMWLRDHASLKKETTYANYEVHINKYIIPAIGTVRLQKLNPAIVKSLVRKITETGISGSTVNRVMGTFRAALNHAVEWELIKKNPAKKISLPKAEKRIEYWTEEECKIFLEAMKDKRMYPIYLLALSTGMRRAEICGLKWKNVDLKKCKIHVVESVTEIKSKLVYGSTKTAAGQRTIEISPRLASVLKKHKAQQAEQLLKLGQKNEEGYVFITRWGEIYKPDSLSALFGRDIVNLKVKKIPFHALRHTFATLMLEAGEHPKVVSEILGHTSIVITLDTYSHVTPMLKKQAAERTDFLIME